MVSEVGVHWFCRLGIHKGEPLYERLSLLANTLRTVSGSISLFFGVLFESRLLAHCSLNHFLCPLY